MRSDLTDVTLVVDRSGSMADCKVEAQGGINSFVEEQKNAPGDCVFSLVQFDNVYEVVHDGIPIKDVPPYQLIPRGMTALLDAVGIAITKAGVRLATMDEKDRPGLVICVIVTDGGENSSNEFTKAQIKEMIERQQNDYQWKFVFLGANQDAFGEAQALGINASGVSNYNVRSSAAAYNSTSQSVTRMRGQSLHKQVVTGGFTDEERTSMGG